MIKLLVVDDEPYTKEGILEDYPWKALGIDEVKGADDGIEALEISSTFNPDIIITDVRMPRMDGITLAYKLRELNPKCRIIFLSGYSDKEYLKSAIYLNAISYVEKPIVYDELLSSIKKAVSQIKEEEERNRYSNSIKNKYENSIPIIKNELALQLTRPNLNIEAVKKNMDILQMYFSDETHFITVLIEFTYRSDNHQDQSFVHASAINIINNILQSNNAQAIIGTKDSGHILFHLYSNGEIPYSKLHSIVKSLSEHFEANIPNARASISAGLPVIGFKNVFKSYNMSVLALQKFFFHDELKYTFYTEGKKPEYSLDEELVDRFQQHLAHRDRDGAIDTIKQLTAEIRQHDQTLINNVKNIYHRFLVILETFSLKEQVSLDKNQDFYWYMISNIKTLTGLESFLIDKINLYFHRIAEQMQSHDAVAKIKNYIRLNYANPRLSLAQISEANFMSVGYLCAFFKEKTGKTVNRYITEVRMEKAKELLMDPGVKIDSIAKSVGYSDGNYFAKIFKKYTGYNPSEYREKVRMKL
jgi:two-component system response regulator YesN